MKNKIKTIDRLKEGISTEMRKAFVVKVQKHLLDEYEMDLGEFEVEEIFDIFCEGCAKIFYNQGIEDAKVFLTGKFTEATEDIDQISFKQE